MIKRHNQISFVRRTAETDRNENRTRSAPLGIVVEVVVVDVLVEVVVVVVEVVVGFSLPLLQLKIRTCTWLLIINHCNLTGQNYSSK